jgi:hypothetical protein
MTISSVEIAIPDAEKVTVTNDTLSVDLSDGRTISVPLGWFPRLVHATHKERNNWRLIGKGREIHWEDLDEHQRGKPASREAIRRESDALQEVVGEQNGSPHEALR